MSPINVIIWSCVAIFIITALLTLLHISGIRPLPNADHGKVLFRALIVEIVVVAVGAFASTLLPDKSPDPGGLPGSMGTTPGQVEEHIGQDTTGILLPKPADPQVQTSDYNKGLNEHGEDPDEIVEDASEYDEGTDGFFEDINEYDKALSASEKIIDLIGQGKYEQVWNSHMSQLFKSTMNKELFKTNLVVGRQSLGKRHFKNLIDTQYTYGDAASGYQGSVYAFTYQNTYAALSLYERVVVINQDGKGFKLAGFWADIAQ